MVRTIIGILLVAAGVAAIVMWMRKRLVRHSVDSPLDRHYAFRSKPRRADAEGLFQSADFVLGSRVVPGRAYLKDGTHWFLPKISIAKCTRGQEAITYWDSKRDNQWDVQDGKPALPPLRCYTREGVPVLVSIRVRYRIVDEDHWLLQFTAPVSQRPAVMGELTTIANKVLGYHSIYEGTQVGAPTFDAWQTVPTFDPGHTEPTDPTAVPPTPPIPTGTHPFAPIRREQIRKAIRKELALALNVRHLELTDVFLGEIRLPREIEAAIREIAVAGSTKLARDTLQPTLTQEFIEHQRAAHGWPAATGAPYSAPVNQTINVEQHNWPPPGDAAETGSEPASA